jgi:hypothetical protein
MIVSPLRPGCGPGVSLGQACCFCFGRARQDSARCSVSRSWLILFYGDMVLGYGVLAFVYLPHRTPRARAGMPVVSLAAWEPAEITASVSGQSCDRCGEGDRCRMQASRESFFTSMDWPITLDCVLRFPIPIVAGDTTINFSRASSRPIKILSTHFTRPSRRIQKRVSNFAV